MVYGDFLACFPELHELITVWTKDDKSDERQMPAMYIPTSGSSIRRRKYTSGNTGLDVIDEDVIYIHSIYISQISEGDYFCRSDKIIWRVVGKVDYSIPADFNVYRVEKVTGATIKHTDPLPVKEGYFA